MRSFGYIVSEVSAYIDFVDLSMDYKIKPKVHITIL